jgi:hypothetical protein
VLHVVAMTIIITFVMQEHHWKVQSWDHSTVESSSRTSTWAITTDFEICLHSAPEFTFGGTLEPVSEFYPLRHVLKIVNRVGVSTMALKCN